jgi:hypothetical protein
MLLIFLLNAFDFLAARPVAAKQKVAMVDRADRLTNGESSSLNLAMDVLTVHEVNARIAELILHRNCLFAPFGVVGRTGATGHLPEPYLPDPYLPPTGPRLPPTGTNEREERELFKRCKEKGYNVHWPASGKS